MLPASLKTKAIRAWNLGTWMHGLTVNGRAVR
jgi:hypothetical protein